MRPCRVRHDSHTAPAHVKAHCAVTTRRDARLDAVRVNAARMGGREAAAGGETGAPGARRGGPG